MSTRDELRQFASKRAANVAGRDHQEKTYAEVRK